MAGMNGVMSIFGRRKPIVLKSETITYPIAQEGELPRDVRFFVKGPGTPLPVLIAVDEAMCVLEENEPTPEEWPTFSDDKPPVPGTISIRRFLTKRSYADRTLRRSLLQAISDDEISLEEANVLASDDGLWKAILVETGWRMPDDEIAADAEDDADPEAQAGESTGADDSPASSTVSPAETR